MREQLEQLLIAVTYHSTTNLSGIHGPQHWRAVARAGARLVTDTPQADPLVVFLFALFHDSKRQNDGYDPEHGYRAALLARELLLNILTAGQLNTLAYALEWHDKGKISDDPTIGACWDGDRLNLWRARKHQIHGCYLRERRAG